MVKVSKNEKGYTLVELLVAMAILVIVLMEVYAVMANSSTIYRKGGYEVQLQSEAQQAVLLLEDIMVDCNGSISYDQASKTLTVSDNIYNPATDTSTELLYTVKYVSANAAAGQYFGMLTYDRSDMTGGPIPLADYVEDFHVDMTGYDNDNITLYIKLANEDYDYTASEDIYLRNEIGSGGKSGGEDTSGATKFLDIKRYGVYDLDEMYDYTKNGFKYDYTEFYFLDGGNKVYENAGPEKFYKIDTNNNTIKLASTYYDDVNDDYGPYLVYAKGKKTKVDGTGTPEDTELMISVHTDPVSWGFADYSFFYMTAGSSSSPSTGLTQFKGIELSAADEITYSYVVKCANGYHFNNDSNGTTTHVLYSATVDRDDHPDAGVPCSQGASCKDEVTFWCKSNGLNNSWPIIKDSNSSDKKEFQVQLPTLHGYVDEAVNAVVAYNGSGTWSSGYSNYINSTNGMLKAGHKFYIQVEIVWPDTSVTYKTYLAPLSVDLTTDEKALVLKQPTL